MPAVSPHRTFRFGAFELDTCVGELRKRGLKIKLQDQPFQVLMLLIDRAGEVVKREEIREKLWRENTFVEFENAISSAVRKVRDALNDDSNNPRFIETVARQGYRFICPVAGTADSSLMAKSAETILAEQKASHAKVQRTTDDVEPQAIAQPAEESSTSIPLNAAVTINGGSISSDHTWVNTVVQPGQIRARRRAFYLVVPFSVIAVTAFAAFVAGWYTGRRSSLSVDGNPLANAAFSKFTDFPGLAGEASISPDGNFIAFRADRAGRSDVWLSQLATGQFVNLTKDQPEDPLLPIQNLGFSPDGSQVWLAGYRPNQHIRLIPIMGGTPRAFLRDHAANLAWSRGGARLVFHTYDPGDPMFVADGNGANARQIFQLGPGGHNHFPAWSLDGRWIYFVSGPWESLDMDIWRIAPDGGSPERMTHHNDDVRCVTPISASTLLYIAPQQDGSGPWIWALDVNRKVSRRVSIGLEHYTSIAASMNKRRLVATVSSATAGLWSVPILGRVATEADVRPFPMPTDRALAPRFTRDSVFYLSSHGTADGLWRLRRGHAFEIWKGAEGQLLVPASISPDTRSAAIVLRQNGKLRLHLISTDGAEIQPLTDAIDVRGTPCWSPDGNWILTGGSDASGPGLFKIPAAGGRPVRLAVQAGINPVWSPDGTLIIYAGTTMSRFAPLLGVRPDGSPAQLPSIGVGAGRGINTAHHRFTADGKGLVYLKGLGPGQDFWLLDLASLTTRLLADLGHGTSMTFDITPDGKKLVFDRIQEHADIVLIDLPK